MQAINKINVCKFDEDEDAGVADDNWQNNTPALQSTVSTCGVNTLSPDASSYIINVISPKYALGSYFYATLL